MLYLNMYKQKKQYVCKNKFTVQTFIMSLKIVLIDRRSK